MSVTEEWDPQGSGGQWGSVTKDSACQTNEFEIYPERIGKPLKSYTASMHKTKALGKLKLAAFECKVLQVSIKVNLFFK